MPPLKNGYFDQRLECTAPIHWSKYTTDMPNLFKEFFNWQAEMYASALFQLSTITIINGGIQFMQQDEYSAD